MLDTADIERARAVPIERVVAHLQLRRRGYRLFGPCPTCGGDDRFWVNLRTQQWGCRGCFGDNHGEDVIGLVRHLYGLIFVEAVEQLTGGTIKPARSPSSDTHKPKPDDGNRARAAAIWHAAAPIAGTAGADYLAARGILLDRVPDHGGLRFHAHCPFLGGTTAPCIIARFTDIVANIPRGIWRRPVDGGKPMSLGPSGGAVIRLWPDEAVTTGLVVAEGTETALAAATRITHRGTLLAPAWACGSAGTLANFPVLAGIEALTILVDNDPEKHGRRAGPEAAEACARRWSAAGREVIILTPDDIGFDFNDVVRP